MKALHSDNDENDQSIMKKARLNEEGPASPLCRSVRANDHISLSFPRLSDQVHKPTFTHQLFEDEKMDFLSADEQKLQICVDVDVASGLRHFVTVRGSSSHITTQLAKEGIQFALPDDTVHGQYAAGSASAPIGTLLTAFAANGLAYEMYLATDRDTGAGDLLRHAEKLAMWFIETADSVDFADPRWEVLFLYQLDSPASDEGASQVHLFVGYTTLFTFHNPALGDRLRICQALVLPPAQGRGLGWQMLSEAYRLAMQREVVTEITVEDPCPEFAALRDAVDVQCASKHYGQGHGQLQQQGAAQLAKDLKITIPQANFACEMLDYVDMLNHTVLAAKSWSKASHDCEEDEEDSAVGYLQMVLTDNPWLTAEVIQALQKAVQEHDGFSAFRLRVKRNLLNEDKELKAMDKPAMQAELVTLFEERVLRYRKALKTCFRLGLLKL